MSHRAVEAELISAMRNSAHEVNRLKERHSSQLLKAVLRYYCVKPSLLNKITCHDETIGLFMLLCLLFL